MSRTIVVCGGGGFIGGHLVKRLAEHNSVRAVDKKPLMEWYQQSNAAENLCLDLSISRDCRRACENADDVYQLAASMGGMGWIERERIDCMCNTLINVQLIEAAYNAGVERYFLASSACVYPADRQNATDMPPLRESDAYPAMAERGYGWEKLYAEMLAQEYCAERGIKTYIARFFNIMGPWGTWQGQRAKAPADICRKAIECKENGLDEIEIWGDGQQTRNFTWIGDCIAGIERIMAEPKLVATPINLGSSEMVTINQLVDIAEEIGGVKLKRRYNLDAPMGVRGRNSDNTFIKAMLDWEPTTTLRVGMERTYRWIKQQYMARKSEGKVVQ